MRAIGEINGEIGPIGLFCYLIVVSAKIMDLNTIQEPTCMFNSQVNYMTKKYVLCRRYCSALTIATPRIDGSSFTIATSGIIITGMWVYKLFFPVFSLLTFFYSP